MSDNKFYKDEIMDHFKYPRGKKKTDNPNFSSGVQNPSCGDSVLIEGKIKKVDDQYIIEEISFDGAGCVVSQASTSMLMEKCKGMNIDDALKLTKDDILKMLGIELGPTRMRCALLCLQALQEGLKDYKKSL